MNWRLTDRDVTRANFGDANKMFETATNTMNKGFDAAGASVDSLNQMFDSRLYKTMLAENQRDLVERDQVQSEFNRRMEQILAENPNDPLAQENARNALIRDMRLQGGMQDHQLNQLGLGQTIDPQNKVKYLQNRMIQAQNEANRLNMDPSQQVSMIKDQMRDLAFSEFGDAAPQLLRDAGIDVSYGNLGGSNFASALESRVSGATGLGTEVAGTTGSGAEGTVQPGAVPQTGGMGDVATLYQQGVNRHAANTFLPGNPPSNATSSTMTAERANNYLLQLHNSKDNKLINLDPTNVTTFADARRETRKLGEAEYEKEGRHLAFGPYQIIMGNVNADTFKRAGIEGGEDAPLTLENQRKLAFALARERIQGGGETELDATFVGLASKRDEILEKLGVPDLKGSTLIKYAKEKYGHASERENLDSLMAELEDDIIETEGSPGTLEAVNFMRNMEGQEARNAESRAVAEKIRKNLGSGAFLSEEDLKNPANIYRNTHAILVQLQESRSRLNAISGFPNYEQVSNDRRDLIDIIGSPEDNKISWVGGKTWEEQAKNVTSMVRGIKSAAAEEDIMISDAEAFALLKANYSSDWFGTDIGKKWVQGGGVDTEGSKALIKELKVGELAKTRHDLAILNSAENILQSGAVELEKLTEKMQRIELEAAPLAYERKLTLEQAKEQLLQYPQYKALVTEKGRILERMKNASSQVFNNPAYKSPRDKLAEEIKPGNGGKNDPEGGTGDDSKETPAQLVKRLGDNNSTIQRLSSPTEENRMDNYRALVNVGSILNNIKRGSTEGLDLQSYLAGNKLKSLRILAGLPTKSGSQSRSSSTVVYDKDAPDNFYHHLASAIIRDGFVLNSKEHLKELMKQWKEMESLAIENKRSGSKVDSAFKRYLPGYQELSIDETNNIAFNLFAQQRP